MKEKNNKRKGNASDPPDPPSHLSMISVILFLNREKGWEEE